MAASMIPLTHELLLQRQQLREQSNCKHLWDILEQVKDPEIPVVSIWDLGILQNVVQQLNGHIDVTITPTYSGCPAMREIEQDVSKCLQEAGYPSVAVVTSLSPAWSTDMMTANGREQLREYGIAPPSRQHDVNCPQCGSKHVKKISEFGSTACKALYQCQDCKEPFDYFKCI